MKRTFTRALAGIFIFCAFCFNNASANLITLYADTPVIHSTLPRSGPAGSLITINGSGFSVVPSENIVFVGGIKTTVTAASANALTVIVPSGASIFRTSVTVNGLTAYSRNPFQVTFDGDTTGFKREHFELGQEVYSNSINIADINNDGRQDLLVLHATNGVSVSLNNSTPGSVSFGSEKYFPTGKFCKQSVPGDLDGDGKIDIVLLDTTGNTFTILRNTSSGSTVTFAPPVSYLIYQHFRAASSINIADLDQDGRPDIIATHDATDSVYIFRNQCTIGNILFEAGYGFKTYGVGRTAHIADMNGDGKFDVVVESSTWYQHAPVFINSSTPGNFSFTQFVAIYTEVANMQMTLADLNQDELPDAATVRQSVYFNQVYTNTTTNYNYSMKASSKFLYVDDRAFHAALGDLDGDGKNDLVYTDYVGLSLHRNISLPGGNVGFADSVQYPIFGFARYTFLGDMDGDGVTDILLYQGDRYVMLRNTMVGCNPGPANVLLNASATSICAGSTVTLNATPQFGGNHPTYVWKLNGNEVPNQTGSQLITGALPADTEVMVIMTSNLPCATRFIDTAVMVIDVTPAASHSVNVTPSASIVCAGTAVTFTATPVNGGTAPTYQWKKNGVVVGTNDAVYVDQSLVQGDSIVVTVTSNAACVAPITAISSAVRITIDPGLDPIITIAGNTDIEPGNESALATTVTHAGAGASYQWQDSTAMHGWQNIAGATSSTFNYAPLITGDKIRCKLTSTVCGMLKTATSNGISFNVLTGGRILGNPVGIILQIVDLKLSDNWEIVDIINLATGALVITKNIENTTTVLVAVNGLQAGMYAAVLKRSTGPWHYLKFIKL